MNEVSQPAEDASSTTHRLLATKFFIPAVRTTLIARPRLINRLQESIQRKLTLVSAPAGFGKTTLISEWHASAAGRTIALAWVSLDADDNDLSRFWTYLIAALGMSEAHATSGPQATALLQTPRPPAIKDILTVVLNELNAVAVHCLLVLDDYHLITTPAIHESISFFLEHLPPHLHLVILSRADPALPLGRLRAHDQLLELREADLRFTSDEVLAFLNEAMRLNLSANDAHALETRTEGWIAGLQLAALSLQGRNDANKRRFIQAFAGSNRYILNYLAEEVLQSQPESILSFLLHTSILERLSGSLCDAVTNQGGGSVMLERLQQANLFIVPLDDEGEWYRYHHLFAELLRHRLQELEPGRTAELHRRAGAWYEQNGFIIEAISQTVAASDSERAANLIEQHSTLLGFRGESNMLQEWIQSIPLDLIRARPRLCVIQASALMVSRQLDKVELWLQDAEIAMAKNPPSGDSANLTGYIAFIRADLARLRGDLARSVALGRQALQSLSSGERYLRALAGFNLGSTYFDSGDVVAARPVLRDAIQTLEDLDSVDATSGAMHTLARLQISEGDLHPARQTCEQALQYMERHGARQFSAAGWPLLGLGQVNQEWNEPLAAAQYLTEAIELGKRGGQRGITVVGYMILAQVKQALADPAGALATIQEAEQVVRESRSPRDIARVAMIQAQLWVLQGRFDDAERWASASGLSPTDDVKYPNERAYLALAQLLLAQGKANAALEMLDRLRRAAESQRRHGELVKILALSAAALHTQGELERACSALMQALSLGAPGGFVRSIVDAGAPMADLLQKIGLQGDRFVEPEDGVTKAYVGKLLAALGRAELQPQPGHPLVGSALESQHLLSERELEVLRFISAGLSNQEIADRLVVSLSTVKTHINNTYSKLDVRTRTQALVRARELHLL